MKFSNPESKKALEYAQTREQEAVELYRSCADKANNMDTVAVSNILVEEEQKHYEIVTNLLKETGDVSDVALSDTGTPKDRLQSMFTHRKMEGFQNESASVIDLLKQALENEKESFDLYSKAESEAADNETAAVFKYLAGEENKHYVMVDNLLDYLDKPDRWIYEEENLIFRRG